MVLEMAKQAKRLTRKEKIELSKKIGIDLSGKSNLEISKVVNQRRLSDDLEDIKRKHNL